MTVFHTVAMIDWSGGNDTGARPRKDAIWICMARDGDVMPPVYLRNRSLAETWLCELIDAELAAGRRLLLGFDFPFGYPTGFAKALLGAEDPLALWDWFEAHVEDSPKSNNRFDLAGDINLRFGGLGPFWANGLRNRDIAGLPRTKERYANPFPDRRAAELDAPGAFTCWQMAGAGAVGGQVFTGLPVLARLRRRFPGHVAVWPFEPLTAPVSLLEVWPSLIGSTIEKLREQVEIKDAAQVRVLAQCLSRMAPDELAMVLQVPVSSEGWIFGLGHEELLSRRAQPDVLRPPPLQNDCFSLPAGVDWIPIDAALARLRAQLSPVTGIETVPLIEAANRILAWDLLARRTNPPLPNAAVDGYGLTKGYRAGAHQVDLLPGRAAAGVPYAGPVPDGKAVRVLTGAALPEGITTVVLEEDVAASETAIAFHGPLKPGANARRAGEDIVEGDLAVAGGAVLRPPELALLAAVGHGTVPVRQRLRVAVLSTGDELTEPGAPVQPGQIGDANRPMLQSMMTAFGFEPVDLGRVPDDRDRLQACFDQAAAEAHALLTSGGASAGDEDHVSALLREAGAMRQWRMAVKPGRPLALGLWRGMPVFGLPGNPVAALVCALIFARPALQVLAGGAWVPPQGFDVPAAFSKNKKPGRREYLRARLRDGRAEVFASEGSGRITGLSWADGLVELEDGARQIEPGDPVRYIPYASFGL